MATTAYRAKPPNGATLRRGNPLASGLVAAWLFSEGAGSRAADSAGAHPGTLTNFNHTSSSGWVGGPFGRCVRLDGSNDYISTGLTTAAIGTPFTIAGLVRFNNVGGTVQVVWGVNNSILVHVSASDLRWQQDVGGFPFVQATTTRTANVWYHVAVTSTGSSAGQTLLYLDGRQVGGGTAGGTLQTGTLQIGRQVGGASGSRPWAGDIACLGVWRRALSAQAIRRLAADPFEPWRPRQLWPAVAAPITGALSVALAGCGFTAAGGVAVAGEAAATLAADSLAAAGVTVVTGSLTATLSADALASAGVVGVGDPVRVYRVRGDAARTFAVEGRAAASYPVQGDAARAFDVEGD